MHGPQPAGFWSGRQTANGGSQHEFLHAGQRYRVVREFVDYDGHRHPVGEEWCFCGWSFVPYEDGMSFFVSLDDRQEWQLRLQWRDDAQGAILDHLTDYLQALC